MAEVQDKIIEGHSYDGIKEYDNPLPPWWLYLFILTIIWAVIYIYYFHVSDWGPSSAEEYELSLIPTDEQLIAQKADIWSNFQIIAMKGQTELDEGQTIFKKNCISCHRDDGGGGIGPNLTDANWIHGGSFENIANVVINGVPEKGMISWKPLLTPDQILKVSSYVHESLAGQNVMNGKAPQGEIYEATEELPSTEQANTDSTNVPQ